MFLHSGSSSPPAWSSSSRCLRIRRRASGADREALALAQPGVDDPATVGKESGPPPSINRMRLVDAHHHFQDLTHNYYPWLVEKDAPAKLEGDLEPIRRDYLPSDYRSDTASVDLLKSVHIQHGWDPSDAV